MAKFLAGLAVGALAVAIVGSLVGNKLLADKFEYGRTVGCIDGKCDALWAIGAEFGSTPSSEIIKPLFDCKASSAVMVIVDGVKTVRVTE